MRVKEFPRKCRDWRKAGFMQTPGKDYHGQRALTGSKETKNYPQQEIEEQQVECHRSQENVFQGGSSCSQQ